MLTVSETFYSLQGEGPTAGTPAVFLRLKGCNLTCGGLNTVKTKQLDNGATWRCDTTEVWLKGQDMTYDEIKQEWQKNGAWDALKIHAHLVITGGEPLLHQEALILFLDWLQNQLGICPYIEIETNGTVMPKEAFDAYVSQYNVSPKLKNSGMPLERRFNPSVIAWCNTSEKAIFKFVVENEADVKEALADFSPNTERLFLMPAADNREAYLKVSPVVADLCKRYQCYFSSRLQVVLWNKTTGV